jgi:hypothetical protein
MCILARSRGIFFGHSRAFGMWKGMRRVKIPKYSTVGRSPLHTHSYPQVKTSAPPPSLPIPVVHRRLSPSSARSSGHNPSWSLSPARSWYSHPRPDLGIPIPGQTKLSPSPARSSGHPARSPSSVAGSSKPRHHST